jgi:DNA (cytosine-5)-methyltransferase 1
VLAKNFPNAERFEDVRTVGAHNLRPVDVLVGGFPCQDISNAGLRVGIDGERSGLWSEFARIIGELRPQYVLVENVAALLGRGMERVLGDLAEVGYDAEWDCIPAAAVGAPHIRDRVWIFSYPRQKHWYGANAVKILGRIGISERNDGIKTQRSEDRELISVVPGVDSGVAANWWLHQSSVGRTTYGIPGQLHARNGALGNAVVPQIPELYAHKIKTLLEVA